MVNKLPTVNRVTINRNLMLLRVMYVLFLVLITIKCLVIPPVGKQTNVVIWLIQLLPLLVFLPGIFKNLRRHIAGFCYVLLIYFVGIGANMFVQQTAVYTWSSLVLIIGLYTSGMMHVRWTRHGVIVDES